MAILLVRNLYAVHVEKFLFCSSLQNLYFNSNSFFPFTSEVILLATGIMATYGKIGEFEPSIERWDNYIEPVDEFFIANGIKTISRKRRRIIQYLVPIICSRQWLPENDLPNLI